MKSRNFILMAGVSVLALASHAGIAVAQTPAASSEPVEQVEQVVVTGSAIVRDGYQSPTPVQVLSLDELLAQAPVNIADAVNQLPAVSGGMTSMNNNQGFSAGTVGIASMNLRNIGSSRTLVLLDGKRSVPSSVTGIVDVNTFPQELVSRVDVVTGGASAVYGSDALAGVVNFILDKNYTGLKGEMSGGITDYGDDTSWKLVVTAGTPFANGRGHFLISGEINHVDGITGVPRAWAQTGRFFLKNPAYTATNGQPANLILSGAGFSTATPGGIITSGPLRGTAFGPGGTPYQYNYGTIVSDPVSVGGNWATNQANDGNSLDQRALRSNIFSRVSYDLTDDINVYAQFSYTQATTSAWDVVPFNFGNLSIKADNPFIPATVAARVQALSLTGFNMGSFWADLQSAKPFSFRGTRDTTRGMIGASGVANIFGSDWHWDVYGQLGFNASSENGYAQNTANAKLAIDAVLDPGTGAVVCRSTLTDPNNGCVPYNIFGIGVNTPEAIHYVSGNGNYSYRHQGFSEKVISATISGEPFSNWAGPVSLALGIQHRRDAVKGSVDPFSPLRQWFSGNYLPTIGSFNVTEGFVEAVVPVFDGFILNLAARETDYSTSGMVTTYKAGAEYSPVDDIRFRATQSRDIRAPNLSDLYAAGTAGTDNIFDPKYNLTYSKLTITSGNPNLKPEVADTTDLGVVLTPRFFPGFSASIDWYNINIKNGIGGISPVQILDNCMAGQAVYCAAIDRDPTTDLITVIRRVPFNLASQVANGLDFEASYTTPLSDIVSDWGGDLRMRVLATNYLKNRSDNGLGTINDSVGINDNLSSNTTAGPPNWVFKGTITYTNHPFTVSLTGRGLSSGVFANNGSPMVQCTSGCPASTSQAQTVNDNHVPGAFYFDTSINYDYGSAQFFFAVRNVLNTDPPILPSATGVPMLTQTNLSLYDALGRTYRGGVRFNF
jgi:outer membrane receptor protein involved in Fe transport